jgi:polysaccharide biosynthesis/export protein
MNHKWILSLIFLGTATSTFAQDPESLMIGAGDVVHVQVLDTPSLEEHARVTDAGFLPMLIGGDVKVSGLTPVEAAHAIEKMLVSKEIMLTPHVLVTVEQFAARKVTLMGEVRNPGAYEISTPRPVLDVLALAGGLTAIASRHIVIERYDGGTKIPFYVSNDPTEAMDTNVKIYPGDTIMAPRAGIVYALGDLKVPGGYTMTDNEGKLSVLGLIARAGGTAHTADAPHTRLIRKSGDGYVEMDLDLRAMLNGKKSDIPLQPSDIVYVPFSWGRNVALGASSIIAEAGYAAVFRF